VLRSKILGVLWVIYRDKKVVGVFVLRFRAPLHLLSLFSSFDLRRKSIKKPFFLYFEQSNFRVLLSAF
jgi:hypothetical protein